MAQHASDPPVNQPATLVWVTFFWAAVILALAAGFGLGGALLRCPPLGCPIGTWWVAAARVHGHVQLVGWAGLMVLGVGFHLLPRLRGRPLAHPVHARTALGCLLAGLLLRALTDPVLALNARAPLAFLLRAGLALSGLLELVGVTIAIGLLVLTLQANPPARSRPGLQQVLPLLGTAFVGFWLGALANLLAVLEVALGDNGTGGALDRLAILPALYLFLIPIAVGMGARVFPLHFAAKQADQRLLRLGLALLLLGVLARVAGDWAGEAHIRAAGLALLAAGLCLFVIGVRVFAARRAVPGERRRWYKDPAQWHGITDTAWLGLDAITLAVAAVAVSGGRGTDVPVDAERHIVGAGFVTLLIFGEGANLLPGFARRPHHDIGRIGSRQQT